MSYYYYQQSGGVKCSKCGSPGTNMSTCPLNPDAAKPNPVKHPLATPTKTTSTALVPAVQTNGPTKAEIPFTRAGVAKADEIAKINALLKRINDLSEEKQVEELWVDGPTMLPFLLTMKDLESIKNNKKKYYVIQPQTYETIEEFTEDPQYFEEYEGVAVTGGGDLWILYKKGLVEALESVVHDMEALE